jgi:hydroxymethylpyrimidine kinase/phosphomethylpyrimidine kinase
MPFTIATNLMTKLTRQPVVMTIGGLDPSGGAGILADVKTISAFGCYGVAAVTSVTFQNTRQVFGAHHQAAEMVRQQVAPLFADFEIAAIKTGMLPTPEIIREVAGMIKAKTVPVLVVDPVLTSTSGLDLIDDGAVDALTRYLFPLASLVTPNFAEAERITGIQVRGQFGVRRAAEMILETGARAVLVTGGDATSDLSTDFLVDAQGDALYSSERIRSKHTHGTGCTLASALACLLATGRSLRESVPIAKQYVNQAILSAPRLGHGHGPLNHFPPGFEIEE